MQVMIAAGSQMAADAGAEVAALGGNAVDAAVAAMFVSMSTEPGIVGPGAGGFLTIWAPGEEPVVVDAYAEMPGRGLAAGRFGHGVELVHLDYGGGVATYVGYGSVGTPGGVAGLEMASEQFGLLRWSALLAPAIRAVEAGFPLPPASAEYLGAAHRKVYGWDPASRAALHDENGDLLAVLATVHLPELAVSLHTLSGGGAAELYTGSIAARIVAAMESSGGIVTAADLAAYAPIARRPILVDHGGWQVATNPAPAVGGAVLASLVLLAPRDEVPFSSRWVDAYAAVQADVLQFRARRLAVDDDRLGAVAELLGAASSSDRKMLRGSPSTTHCSAVDASGLACAVTMSAGYGSGAMPAGIWLNNSLGEVELVGEQIHTLDPGTRLVSNMAPTIARHPDGSVLAIGSPGADRITTSLASTLLRYTDEGLSLQGAVDAPRMHLEVSGDVAASVEPGIAPTTMPTVQYPQHAMYFGGVQAVSWHPEHGFAGAADPRRTGGVALS
jgi:gamma-glutamyltranspeptidase/glutathione hydrolase